jgi:hypothetical protein
MQNKIPLRVVVVHPSKYEYSVKLLWKISLQTELLSYMNNSQQPAMSNKCNEHNHELKIMYFIYDV